MKTKTFKLGDVLSVTTDRLVSENHIQGVYEILNHMTGESLFTHALVRAGKVCKGPLCKAFPECDPDRNPFLRKALDALTVHLAQAVDKQVELKKWLRQIRKEHPAFKEYYEVSALVEGTWKQIDPLTELAEMTAR